MKVLQHGNKLRHVSITLEMDGYPFSHSGGFESLDDHITDDMVDYIEGWLKETRQEMDEVEEKRRERGEKYWRLSE